MFNIIITLIGIGLICLIYWACANNKSMNEDGSECPKCKDKGCHGHE